MANDSRDADKDLLVKLETKQSGEINHQHPFAYVKNGYRDCPPPGNYGGDIGSANVAAAVLPDIDPACPSGNEISRGDGSQQVST